MDFWLLVGRLVRRWYVTVPLFIVAGFVAGGVASSVRSTYEVETQVLLAPAGVADQVAEASATNPLLAATRNQLDAATQAAVLVLDSPAAAAERQRSAPGADVAFVPIEEAPIIVITAAADDPDVVQDAVTFGVDQLEQALEDIQAPLGTDPEARIETVSLAVPTVVEQTGDRQRVLLGSLVAGVLTAGLLVLAIDQLLRRRLERRLTADLDGQAALLTNGSVEVGPRHRGA